MKKSFVWFIFVLFLLLLLFGCGSFRKKAQYEQVKNTGNIAGLVICEGHPASDAWVSVLGIKTTTDSTGRFFISGISPGGGYTVMAGGERYIKSFVPDVQVRPDSTTVIVFYLEYLPFPRRHAEIKGLLRSDRTSFLKMDYKQIAKLDLPKVEHPTGKREEKKTCDSIITIPGPSYPEGPIELDHDEREHASVIEIKTGNIAGVVYSGGPLPKAVVVVQRLSGEWEEVKEYKTVSGEIFHIKQRAKEKITYTDSLGRYFFSGIDPGEYEMYARGESGLYKTDTYEWRYDYKMTKAKGIKVAPDSTTIVNFGIVPGLLLVEPPLIEHEDAIIVCDSICFFGKKFKDILYVQPVTKDLRYKTGNIAGIVYDKSTEEPLAGAVVYIEGMATIGTKTDTLGRFWLSSIPVGEYSIQASQIGFHTGKVSNVKVDDNLTSIVTTGLVIGAIEPWGTSRDWGGKIINIDSVSFFSTQYKDLVKNK